MSDKIITLDVETTGLNPRKHELHGVGVAYEEDRTSYFAVKAEPSKKAEDKAGLEQLRAHLSDSTAGTIGHNLRFDMHFLTSAGYEVNCRWWDTKILAKLVNENRELGLKPLSQELLGEGSLEEKSELDKEITKSGLKTIDKLIAAEMENPSPTNVSELISKYCQEDCNNTHKIFYVLTNQIKKIDTNVKGLGYKKSPLDYYIEEAMPLEPVLMKIEKRGVKVNLDRVHKAKIELEEQKAQHLDSLNFICINQINQIEEGLFIIALEKRTTPKGRANVVKGSEKYKTKYNWDSGTHIGALLELYELPISLIERTKTGLIKTDAGYLKHLQWSLNKEHPLQEVLDLILRLRKTQTYLKTFIGEVDGKGLLGLIEDSRIYPQYLQVGYGKEGSKGGPVTGRLSSKSPNFQNIPKEGPFRGFFVPDSSDYVFWYADYDQIELRVAAHLSQDRYMIDCFNNPEYDPHQDTADLVGIGRDAAKKVNFLVIFGGSAWKLRQDLGDSYSIRACQDIINEKMRQWAGLRRWLKAQLDFGHRSGAVVCENGLVRRLPDLSLAGHQDKESRKRYRHAVNQLYNTPIQSYAATICKRSLVQLAAAGADIVNTVHDSIVCQLPKDQTEKGKFYLRIMESAVKLSVPITASSKLLCSLSEKEIYEPGQSRAAAATSSVPSQDNSSTSELDPGRGDFRNGR